MVFALAACGKKEEPAPKVEETKQEEVKEEEKKEETKEEVKEEVKEEEKKEEPAPNPDPYGIKGSIDAVAASGYKKVDSMKLFFSVSWEAAEDFQGAYNEWKDKFAAYGIEVTMKGPADYTNATQISQIEAALEEGYDAILYYPVENVTTDYKDKAQGWFETYKVPVILYGEPDENCAEGCAQYTAFGQDPKNYAETGKLLACALPFFTATAKDGALSTGMDFNAAMGGTFKATLADINLYYKK